jgi:hypothetical protein
LPPCRRAAGDGISLKSDPHRSFNLTPIYRRL